MKKLLLISLLVSSWSLTFADTIERGVHVSGDYPHDKERLFETICHDTLIFDKFDTIYNTGWEWGLFIPKSNDLYMQNSYYKVIVSNNPSFDRIVCVFKTHEGKKQIIPSYVSKSRWIYWIYICLLLVINYLVYDRLKRLLFKLNRRGRHVPAQRKMKETAAVVILVVFYSSLFGWYIRSYFFLCCPIVYILFMLMPSGRWHHYFKKKSERAIIGI